MIKSKAHKKYYGKKAYADGYYGRIREHSLIEDADGMHDEYTLEMGDGYLTVENVVVINKLNFVAKANVIVAIADVDGRTYVGYAVANPKDENLENHIGRRLALARALQDADGEAFILDEVSDLNNPDGDDEEDEDCEPEYIGCCEWCGEDIYEADEWFETSDGNLCCCEDCHDSYETALAEDEEDCEEDEEE